MYTEDLQGKSMEESMVFNKDKPRICTPPNWSKFLSSYTILRSRLKAKSHEHILAFPPQSGNRFIHLSGRQEVVKGDLFIERARKFHCIQIRIELHQLVLLGARCERTRWEKEIPASLPKVKQMVDPQTASLLWALTQMEWRAANRMVNAWARTPGPRSYEIRTKMVGHWLVQREVGGSSDEKSSWSQENKPALMAIQWIISLIVIDTARQK